VSLRKGITRSDEAPKKAGKPGLWELKTVPNLSKNSCIKLYFLRARKLIFERELKILLQILQLLMGCGFMGLFKRFRPSKAKIDLKLDEFAYDATSHRISGRIVVDPQEDVSVDELRLEFGAAEKGKIGSFRFSSSMKKEETSIAGPVKLQKGQHYDKPFQIDIPLLFKRAPFTEIEVKMKGVAAVKGRPDLTHELKPAIKSPYIIECLKEYGGCGFITQPLSDPISVCPKCKSNLEEIWSRKIREEFEKLEETMKSQEEPSPKDQPFPSWPKPDAGGYFFTRARD
jgi:hypothetical protein